MSITQVIDLKAAGRLQRAPLMKLSSASVTPQQINAAIEDWEETEIPACLHPDFPDQEIALADPDDVKAAFAPLYDGDRSEAIQKMHQRMLKATGSGSWPPGNRCHPTLYPHVNFHATTFWVDWSEFMGNNSLARNVTDEEWQTTVIDARVWPNLEKPVSSIEECKRLFVYTDTPQGKRWANAAGKKVGDPLNVLHMGFWLCIESTRRAGVMMIERLVEAGDNIHFNHFPIPGSTSGYAYFPDGTCGDHVTNNTDSGLSYGLGGWAGLLTHETGHNLQLEHEFRSPQSSHRSIMSYAQDNAPFQGYRLKGAPYQYTEDHSWTRLRSLFGGEWALPLSDFYPTLLTPLPPVVEHPLIDGTFRGRQVSGKFVIDGDAILKLPANQPAGDYRYVMEPTGTEQYRLVKKAQV